MHIQKTAGTAIVQLIRAHYGYANSSSHGDHFYQLDELTLENRFFLNPEMVGRYNRMPFISGHFGFDFCHRFMDGRFSFTFLRDPIERVLSYYYFCQGRDPKEYFEYGLSQSTSLEQFLQMGFDNPALRIRIWNNMTWTLAHGNWAYSPRAIDSFSKDELLNLALDHLSRFTFIGLAEFFQQDRNTILQNLEIPIPSKNEYVNANLGRPKATDLPDSVQEMLASLTDLDQIIYNSILSTKNEKRCLLGCGSPPLE